MTSESPARVRVPAINQIALVVRDVEETAKNFWELLGIGLWNIYAWEAPLVSNRKYHGRPTQSREKIANIQFGPIRLELCQPVEGDSIYRDFLEEHGEGLHHLNFLVDDADGTARKLAEQGFPSIQSGHRGTSESNSIYYYVDIKPLHCIWEPVQRGGDTSKIGTEPVCWPPVIGESQARVRVPAINQVAIVVRDIEETVRDYWNVLGIGPWEIRDWEAPLVYDRRYHGRPVWARERIANAQVGPVQLELCQPVEGDSIYRDFLEEHGEGLHHINFLVEDIDATAAVFTGQGFSSIQSGRVGPREEGGGYNYIDIPPLHTIVEPVHRARIFRRQPPAE
jgi:catechol 2,3-dioxygenase-like lactoylglutathione lyase family enzyme